ncbi:MAG: hypothetical protein Q9174_001061 [Haloplaca sp. 1 TL-2023]
MASEHDISQPMEQDETDDRVVDTSDGKKSGPPNPLPQTARTLSRFLKQDRMSENDCDQAISALEEAIRYTPDMRYFVKLRHSTFLMALGRHYEPRTETTRNAAAALLKPMNQMDRKLVDWSSEMQGVIDELHGGSKRQFYDLDQIHSRLVREKIRAQLVREIVGGALEKGIRLCQITNDDGLL